MTILGKLEKPLLWFELTIGVWTLHAQCLNFIKKNSDVNVKSVVFTLTHYEH